MTEYSRSELSTHNSMLQECELLMHVLTCIILKCFALSKRRQNEQVTYFNIRFIWHFCKHCSKRGRKSLSGCLGLHLEGVFDDGGAQQHFWGEEWWFVKLVYIRRWETFFLYRAKQQTFQGHVWSLLYILLFVCLFVLFLQPIIFKKFLAKHKPDLAYRLYS